MEGGSNLKLLPWLLLVAMVVACNHSSANQLAVEGESGASWASWAKNKIGELIGLKPGFPQPLTYTNTKPATQIIKGFVKIGGGKTEKNADVTANKEIQEAKENVFEATTKDNTMGKALLLRDAFVKGVQALKAKAQYYIRKLSNKASKVNHQAQQHVIDKAQKDVQELKEKSRNHIEEVSNKASKVKETMGQKVEEAKETMARKAAYKEAQDNKDIVEEDSSWVREKAKKGYDVVEKVTSDKLYSAKEMMKKKASDKAQEIKEMIATHYTYDDQDNEL